MESCGGEGLCDGRGVSAVNSGQRGRGRGRIFEGPVGAGDCLTFFATAVLKDCTEMVEAVILTESDGQAWSELWDHG